MIRKMNKGAVWTTQEKVVRVLPLLIKREEKENSKPTDANFLKPFENVFGYIL